ncbi:hypothetical protein C8A05DRAFT_42874 [Staphylotrichum tortipilum]|uniref:F-box domain-containing protein n=1 Tax=Staphylotrichum tortipilum TaxID=2831512 RepID=A0AAN6MNP2_9PEZI|nr:hypothetical protein C8A05DRAFT_42874 [Staphylotrichum longicolle]
MAADIPPRYRSTTEYCFSEEQADAIVDVVASKRSDFRLAVISFPPGEHDTIRQSIATPFRRAAENDASTGLGNLSHLPLEILQELLPHMDMTSLFTLRQANLSSRRAVDSLPQYRAVTSHGLDVFCALLRTRLAADVSLLDFYDALCSKACALCGGEFAEFVLLLAWGRCCFSCFYKDVPEARVQALDSVRSQFSLTTTEAGQLRSFETLPGTYSMDATEDEVRTTVVPARQVETLFRGRPRLLYQRRQPPPQPGWPILHLPSRARSARLRFMAACALPHYDKRTGQTEYGVACAACCQLAVQEPPVSLAATSKWAYEAYERVYSRLGFLEHFRWCRRAQDEWTWANEGGRAKLAIP